MNKIARTMPPLIAEIPTSGEPLPFEDRRLIEYVKSRRPTPGTGTTPGKFPDFIVIGAMKSGSTSLYYYLRQHPEIAMSSIKELNFFYDEGNWSRGHQWYRAQFPSDARVAGEISPNYTNYPCYPWVPERMHAVIPKVKLVYVLRHPLERMISQFVHQVAAGYETRSFTEALSSGFAHTYIARSLYHLQLKRYTRFYPLSSFHLITQEELLRDRRKVLRGLFRFLGVDEGFTSPFFLRKQHQSITKRRLTRSGIKLGKFLASLGLETLSKDLAWKLSWLLTYAFSRRIFVDPLPEDLQKYLLAAFREDVARLSALSGKSFKEWDLE